MKMSVTIAGLARSAEVGVETVRYYQRRGLLGVPKTGGSVRRYDQDDLRRLRFIRRAQAAGFTLDEIAELLRLDRNEDREQIQSMAADRIAALDTKIEELENARAALERLRATCASGKGRACPIIEAFDAG